MYQMQVIGRAISELFLKNICLEAAKAGFLSLCVYSKVTVREAVTPLYCEQQTAETNLLPGH